MHYVLVAIYSYLLGAIPSAYIIGNIKGIDITSEGSGNIAAPMHIESWGLAWNNCALMDVGKVLLALIITRSWLISEAATACAVLAAMRVTTGLYT